MMLSTLCVCKQGDIAQTFKISDFKDSKISSKFYVGCGHLALATPI